MMRDLCLITGCDFLDVAHKRWIHGDLHQLGSALIFNATGCEWNACEKVPLDSKNRIVRADQFYERNSQIVFPLEIAVFNDIAHQFLMEIMAAEESRIIVPKGRLQ